MRHNAKLAKLVERTLHNERRHGTTTLKTVTDKVVTHITRHGGYKHFGIGDADILMALRAITSGEVKHQFKRGLPESTFKSVLPSAPPALVQLMHKLTYFISLGEGHKALWVCSLDASAEQWELHSMLKMRKAEQTIKAVEAPQDVARLLVEHGVTCLDALLKS